MPIIQMHNKKRKQQHALIIYFPCENFFVFIFIMIQVSALFFNKFKLCNLHHFFTDKTKLVVGFQFSSRSFVFKTNFKCEKKIKQF
jgi:hypothetical protein